MRIKKLDQKLCPVCREGHIAQTKLESPDDVLPDLSLVAHSG